jgi:glycolate oxidase iron-sulfur subunit
MLHSIPTEKLGAFGPAMAGAVQACVHCGFCLATCPTYGELGQEMDTPRGRIVLMKQALEGGLPFEAAQPHVDRCLGCLACEPACPSGVRYRDLVNPFRALARSRLELSRAQTLKRFLLAQLLPFPDRFRLAAQMGVLAKRFSSSLPRAIQSLLELLPETISAQQTWPAITRAQGQRRARVAVLTGCVQQVLNPDINTATVEVLSRNGVEVLVPPNQGCCGGLAWHTGDLAAAQRFASDNIAAFPHDVDAILTNAAGCGSTMREYQLVLKDTGDENRVDAFCDRVMDVSVFLDRVGLRELPGPLNPQRIAYQDACHLAHAQGVSAEPRRLLRAIPGIELVELADAHLCCGSAGTYNMDQPEIAAALGQKKARAIMATGAQIVASGNVGCINQVRLHLAKLGSPIPVRHTMQILRDAYNQLPDLTERLGTEK